MSDVQLSYSPLYIKVWTALSILLALVLLGMFVFGQELIEAGGVIWALLRWLASPFI